MYNLTDKELQKLKHHLLPRHKMYQLLPLIKWTRQNPLLMTMSEIKADCKRVQFAKHAYLSVSVESRLCLYFQTISPPPPKKKKQQKKTTTTNKQTNHQPTNRPKLLFYLMSWTCGYETGTTKSGVARPSDLAGDTVDKYVCRRETCNNLKHIICLLQWLL